MTDWDRKDADTLADAIGKHIRNHPDMGEENELLAVIRSGADNASESSSTTSEELQRYRSLVCAICRGAGLYECDADEGWSRNCQFISSNTTGFGGLL